MKINTDGVLLGALAHADHPKAIVDVGTGTGVIALMLAQRFADATIDAVEIDGQAAQTAAVNFAGSPFAERLTAYPLAFDEFFEQYHDKKFDLIVSNPPFYINSLSSPKKERQIAKHADKGFFEALIKNVSEHLNQDGIFCTILPPDTAELVHKLAREKGLSVIKQTNVLSYKGMEPHREVLFLSSMRTNAGNQEFVIYNEPQVYSKEYRETLKDFFTIF
ncbi:MAG: methyltransferase [Bacteroidetes bacterium]|nr:methyltransferase [Bacteroidota bacterium]